MGFFDRPQKLWWRKAMFQIHLWVGIFLALYVIVISLSGCVLIFGNEITDDAPRISTQASSVNPSALDSAIAAAHRLYADYNLASIEITRQSGKASRIEIWKSIKAHGRMETTYRSLYFDPSTGLIVFDLNQEGRHPVYDFIADLHEELLLAGSPGLRINGACAALLLLLCLTGIVIWWPGRVRWTQALGVKWSASWKRINFDAHSAIGFWTLLIVSVWAVTGVYFGYPIDLVLKKMMPFAASAPEPKTNWKPGDPMLSPVDLYRQAQRALPGERITEMDFPSRLGDRVNVSFLPSRSPQYLYSESVLLSPTTGQILRIREGWQEGRAGDRLLRVLVMLHFAAFDSLTLKIIFALLGFAPVVLTITGALMWWNRVLSKKWAVWRNAEKPNTGGESAREPVAERQISDRSIVSQQIERGESVK